ncbi:MAG: hypothetical protein EPO02_13150 [Nitrospirae bacterium]|nr:MAG: hypothetical protein EPO02_13150 [Nitrospirota bacterium]
MSGKTKVKSRPWIFEIHWGSPYTNPPDGMPRVLMSVTRVQAGGNPVPDEIEAAYAKLGFGKGWCLSVGCDPTPIRKLSPEAKGKLRRKSLERRVRAKAPLFAESLIQIELNSNPTYYGGADYR